MKVIHEKNPSSYPYSLYPDTEIFLIRIRIQAFFFSENVICVSA